MNNRFQENFEKGLSAVCASLSKKSGIKTEEKVYERVGRLKQKYPSISRYYTVDYRIEVESKTKRKTKQTEEIRKVTAMSWTVKPDIEVNEQSGTYFLRTSLSMSENTTWTVYSIIREVESTFRTLKTDIDLRPIYHKKDESTMAHLHLGLLAYWVVNTIRYQLKKSDPEDKDASKCLDKNAQNPEKKMNYGWKEIVRIMNTQKPVLTVSQNCFNQVIISRRCSDSAPKVEAIYKRLHYKSKPFNKRKFVVHKSDFQKINLIDLQIFLL